MSILLFSIDFLSTLFRITRIFDTSLFKITRNFYFFLFFFYLPHIYFQNDEINNDDWMVWMIDALHGDFESTSSCSLSSLIKFPEINIKGIS